VAGLADWANFIPIWVTWWLGDAAGAVVVTPVIVLWANTRLRSIGWKEAGDIAVVLGCAVAVGLVAFSPLLPRSEYTSPLGFLAILPLVLAALRRGPRDTKYTSGSVLVVGGSPGLTGAACLATEAAFRADAGYVTVAAPESSLPVLETRLLEAVKRPLGEVDDALHKASAVALGPGLGRGTESHELVARILAESELPAVVDADALFELEPFSRTAPTVLTPHAGELGRLLGEEPSWVDAHRLEAARRAAERFQAVCVLKGADTIVAAPDAHPLVCALGTAGLATAGSGDVLTGVLGAFLAKGLDARTAAAAAVAAQQVASTLVPNQGGMVASDVIAALPRALDAAV
jgi:NAD(P)H-hydrate epimerase